MKKNLHRFYGGLTSEERFRLTVRALVRGDSEEIESLKRSCPRKTYSELDAAFSGCMEGITTINRMWYLTWRDVIKTLDSAITTKRLIENILSTVELESKPPNNNKHNRKSQS